MPLTEQQRQHLERRLHEERDQITRILARIQTDQSTGGRDRDGDLSDLPTHLADEGTDTFDAELDASNAARASEELREIDAALDRLYRDPERFGICEETGEPISFERLDLIPWARTCGPERGANREA